MSPELIRAVQEAWAWLLNSGFISLDDADPNRGVYFITRRGRATRNRDKFDAFRSAGRLPREMLHQSLQEEAYLAFLRADFGTAVFQAFRAVEIAVREISGLNVLVGGKLMRRAFDPKSGPLTDMDVDSGERQGLADLFAGAMGSYKNPHSHRHVEIDAADAAEMLVLASHLLRIVDARRPQKTGQQ